MMHGQKNIKWYTEVYQNLPNGVRCWAHSGWKTTGSTIQKDIELCNIHPSYANFSKNRSVSVGFKVSMKGKDAWDGQRESLLTRLTFGVRYCRMSPCS